ncbi:toll-like receptor 6 [Daphnia pulicaria]|uniref:toll-like receptor 6 n=1 Tax=Daphnia pulicaria TaxID=35523 RepID=UPI001EEBB807|nr:toll-like receptor 6 [Daphnia pulicaria]XP_046651751.1 toll-like receptor 6 [Daphnia pulicaria]XP_046651753.1 toll-like receptor 6 [Daphnia pulicaria]XP_046651754.1 toll-like receptor 6 [Daphnia pulicaria]XP_046651755.1 toll-like receptor 6 [Daphnia pulicaria]
MKYLLAALHIILIVTVAAENVARMSMARGQNAERIENRPTGDVSVVDACQEDYYPCTCYTYPSEAIPSLYVQCTNVPSFASVQSVFLRTTARQVKEFVLTIPSFETNKTIPADLLSSKGAQEITLNCPDTETQLTVDPAAFSSSKDYTNLIRLNTCDLSQLSYAFLANFNVLREVSYFSSINVAQWSGLPSLPSLQKLSMSSSPDFTDFGNVPFSKLPALSEYSIVSCPNFELLPNTTAMKVLRIESCPLFKQWDILAQQSKVTSLTLLGLDSQTIKDALDSVISSPSVGTLTDLALSQNGLNEVPARIQLFSQLRTFSLSRNIISFVKNGSLSFSTLNLQYLDLSRNGLDTIEPNAFQGNFGKTVITLSYNRLSRLESSIFKPILEQMESTDQYGYVDIYENPIECDCHLDWLFVDNNNLVDRVHDGQCSNGTYFSWLKPQDFSSCKSGSTISTTTNNPLTPPSIGGASSSLQLFSHIHFVIPLFTFLFLQKTSLV